MKPLAFIFLLLMSCEMRGQQNDIRLIVRGDDMGYTHSGNEAIIKCMKEGIQTSIEVIVPSPWFPEAVKMLKANPGADIGIHLALTSEWDNIKWRPVSDCPSLKDENGYFYPFIFKNNNYPGRSLQEKDIRLEDVEKEFRNQIELALKSIKGVSHISAHMGCTNLSAEVKALTKKLAQEYDLDVDLEQLGVENVWYDGPHKTFAEKKSSFIKMLTGLDAGKTYLFVDHPGLDTPELRAVSHMGYEDVAEDRQGVTSLWTDPDVRTTIEQKGIKLIGYRDLVRN